MIFNSITLDFIIHSHLYIIKHVLQLIEMNPETFISTLCLFLASTAD